MNGYIISLGCCKNLVDSEQICGLLASGGVKFVSRPSLADFILINTCGFIESAKKEAIETILDIADYKNRKDMKLIVTGCLAQRYLDDLKHDMPEVDRFISIDEYKDLAKIFNEVLGLNITQTYGKNVRMRSNNPWMAYLKLGDGCDNRCAYCAIPLIRGPYHSFAMEDLVAEATRLAKDGVKELVLIAQDTTRYGTDYENRPRLLKELLKQLQTIDELKWIRILYMYPDEIDEALLDTMASCDKVIPYFDIPMQHGNDRMLKIMNRRGSVQDCKDLVAMIRSKFANPILRTTMIVGFPSETEDEFNDLLDFIRDVKWDHLGAFTYSDEEDTLAFEMDGKIEQEVMDDRLNRLMEVQYEVFQEKVNAMIGTTMEVLVEKHDGLTKLYYGRAKYNAPDDVDGNIVFSSECPISLGDFVTVKIKRNKGFDLIAEVVKEGE